MAQDYATKFWDLRNGSDFAWLGIVGHEDPPSILDDGFILWAKDQAGAGTRSPHVKLEAGGVIAFPSSSSNVTMPYLEKAQTWTAKQTFNSGAEFSGNISGTPTFTDTVSFSKNSEAIHIFSTHPTISFRETDQVLPVGAWRIRAGSQSLRVDKNTAVAGDFGTSNDGVLSINAASITTLAGYPVTINDALTLVGITSHPDGTAAAPSITNTGDTDTGIFFPAANAVGIAAFGVEPLRITVTTNLTDAVVAILSTEESTSPTTGALTVADGVGIAGDLWVGGIGNFAGALTLQAGGAFSGTFSGAPILSGTWTFRNSLTSESSGASPVLNADAYSSTVGQGSIISLTHSLSDVVGTKTVTTDGTILGVVQFRGINTASAEAKGVVIRGKQRGAAGASIVPADLEFLINTTVSAAITNEGNFLLGASALPAGSPTKVLILESGAVLGTSATGFTQIGHVATDVLTISVGALATGYMQVNNTLDSTSVGNGSLVTLGGLSVAKALRVGGLVNIAGVATFVVQPVIGTGSTETFYPSGMIYQNSASAANVGSGEDDLHTYTLPGGTLDINTRTIRYTASFRGNGADNCTIKFYFGATSVTVHSGASLPASTGTGALWVTVIVTRTSTTAQNIRILATTGTTTSSITSSSTETMSGDITVKFTGENNTDSSDGAADQRYSLIELLN